MSNFNSNLNPKVDYHIHPGYSIDASPASIDEYCRRAIELQLAEICFTPHLEVDPVRKRIDWFVRCKGRVQSMTDLHWIECYFFEINSARDKYGPYLSVKAGLEVGYEPGSEKQIENILNNFPFDFVLGSIHCINHIAISSKKECHQCFAHHTAQETAERYYAMLEQAVKNQLI